MAHSAQDIYDLALSRKNANLWTKPEDGHDPMIQYIKVGGRCPEPCVVKTEAQADASRFTPDCPHLFPICHPFDFSHSVSTLKQKA